jgi:hypothetical protein
VPPASELTRIEARFDTLCAAALTLPGVSLTDGTLEACVSAVKSSGCQILDQGAGPCAFGPGTLGAQASCITDDQCASGDCSAGAEAPDGGTVVCGTCAATVGLGQACGTGQSCGPDATCTSSNGGPSTCVAVTSVGAGATCGPTTLCEAAGLYCNASGQCTAQGAAGAPCDEENACTPPLVCPLTGTTATCVSPGGVGASCSDDTDCTAGLACNDTTHQCASATWVAAGQPCGGTALCLVGECTTTGNTDSGTCPTVIPDGQPCNPEDSTTTCDTFAQCTQGKCVLGYATCP